MLSTSSHSSFPEPTQSVGRLLARRYRLERRLGEGGMGIIDLATDLHLQRLVALKRLKPNRALDPVACMRLILEGRRGAQVNDRHVVQVLDLGTLDDGQPFVVSEYVDGCSLDRVLRRQRLSVRQATQLMIMACRGLRAVHRAGLLHLDFKPANLLLGRDGALRLADFGVAMPLIADELSESQTRGGSWPYTSPENVWGESLSPASDLYSLGVVYFEMLAGQRPFVCSRVQDYAQAHRDLPPDSSLLDPVPVPCRNIVLGLLAKKPEERPASAAALLIELKEVVRTLDRPDSLIRPKGTPV